MKKIFLICAATVIIGACAFLAVNPGLADRLYSECNFFENLAVVLCGIGLALSLALLFERYREGYGYGFWLFVSLLLIVFIGDDISWGMDYFNITKPKIAGINFDGVHDILSIGVSAVKLTRDYMVSIGVFNIRSIAISVASIISLIALLYFLIKIASKNREKIRSFFSQNLKWEPFLFLIIGVIILSISVIIDDDNLVGFPHKAVVEESLELLAAISFLFIPLSGFLWRREK